MTITTFLITFLTYVAAGSIPPVIAHYVFRVRFLGRAWAAIIVGIVAAVIGGIIDTAFLSSIPDILAIAGMVDVVPPFVASIVITTVYGLVSSSNS